MDRLSSLPCVLREKILCFLPTKNAVATSVLSRIWKVSYLSCDSLILNDSDSIDSRVSNTNLRNFYSHIKCRKSDLVISKFSFVSSRVSKPQLITTVISELKHNYSDISDLDLITRLSHRFNLRLLDLPCQKLRVLKIDSCQCIDKHVLFPCLEIFYCSEVSFLDGCVTEILDGCPVLKDLKLIGCSWFNRDVVFRHDSLEKLEFDAGLKNDCSAVELSAISFDLPNLIWFKYNHGVPKRVSADFDSIVTAHVNICADYHESDFDGNPNPMLELVNGLSGAKYLHFTGSCLKVFTNNLLPKFQNLAQLKLGHCDSVSWSKMIPELVLTSPCLQIVALIQPINMYLAGVGGFKISGNLGDGVTAADVVVSVTHMLKKSGWRFFGKFVKFYGEGMSQVSIVERATLAILSSEYAGATMAFFPTDHVTLEYLKLTGRTNNTVSMIEQYLRADNMFVDYIEPQQERVYSSILELDLAKVEPCMSPKRSSEEMKADWDGCLKGFAIPKEHQSKVIKSLFHCQPAELEHGRVVIAAITSSSKTSNCSVMLGAALVTKKACQLGLERYTGHETIIIAGAEYGSGSSPDWDAKGPVLQGVKAVIAKSFQGIHLSNLVGKGVIFLCFKPGEDAHTLGLTEQEQYTIGLPSHVSELRAGQDVTVTTDAGKLFTCTVNLGTELA